MAEMIDRLFTPEEAARYEAYMRPRIEGGLVASRGAFAYLRAVKR